MALTVVWVLLAVGAILGGLSLHQELTQNFSSDYQGFAQVGGSQNVLGTQGPESRTAGPLGRANRYAQILVLLLPLVFAIVWGRHSRGATLLAIGAGFLISIAAALTLSRGAAVGFALVLLVMLFLRYIKLRHIAIVAVALFALFVVVPQYGARLDTLQSVPGIAGEGQQLDSSVRSRITETIAAALVFADHPLIGVGPGLFPTYYLQYAGEFGLRVRPEDREAHNLYFGIASDTGLLGSFFFFGAIAVTVRDLSRTRSRLIRVRPRLAHLAAGFMLAIVAYLTTGIFLHLAFERYLWLMLALGAAVTAIGLHAADDGGEAPPMANLLNAGS
jgi:O-antigen ligase